MPPDTNAAGVNRRRQRRLLTRLFFERALDNDVLSPRTGLEMGLAGALGVLAMPGVLLPTFGILKYTYPFSSFAARNVSSLGDKCLFVLLAMVAMGALAALQWDTLRPDRRDYQILVPLPVSLTTLLVAKASALGLTFAVFAAAAMSAAPVLFPAVMYATADVGALGVARAMAAHAFAVLSAAAFAFFGMLALNGVLVAALGPRRFRRVSPWIQSAAIFTAAVVFLLLPLVASLTWPLVERGGLAARLAPQVWFVGVYQAIAGLGDPFWREMAALGVLGVFAAVSVAAATLLVGYRRHVSTTLESAGAGAIRRKAAQRGLGWIGGLVTGRDPARLALFSFTMKTMTRSPRHRMILAAFLGMGCAVSAVGLATVMWRTSGLVQPSPTAIMAVQHVLTFFLVAALAVGASVPSDLAANWIFRLLAGRHPDAWLAGFRRAVLAAGVIPLLAVLFPINAALIGWSRASAHALIGLIMSAVLVEAVLFGFRRAPFACAVAPGAGGPKARWALYWLGFTMFASALARIERVALDQPYGWLVMAGAGLLLFAALLVARTWRPIDRPLDFDESPDWAISRLDLTA